MGRALPPALGCLPIHCKGFNAAKKHNPPLAPGWPKWVPGLAQDRGDLGTEYMALPWNQAPVAAPGPSQADQGSALGFHWHQLK